MSACVVEMTLLRLSAKRRTADGTSHKAGHRIGVLATAIGRVIVLLYDLLNVIKYFFSNQ
ncbi:MAG: hypothetical protein Q8R30_05315 [bacterium]|nr:hypothetical protein [bacterium]